MDDRERITIEPGKRGGKPCVRGTRITVYEVLGYLASGMTEDELLEDFPGLAREDIRACLAHASDQGRMTESVPLEALRSVAEDDHRIRALYVHGSRARGEHHEGSDLDVGVLFDGEVGLDDVMRLAERLEKKVGLSVDLVDLRRCDAFLAVDVIDGLRVFCGDEAVDEFELYVLRRAGDLAPFERERRATLLRPRTVAP